MTVRCPGCSKEYPIPALPPGKGAAVRCRVCGTVFRIEAPAAAARASAPRPAAPPGPLDPVFSVRRQTGAGAAPAPQPGAAVLIADESRPFRDALQRAVQELGERCAVVEDGEAALRYVQEQRPRLLLVNVYLRKLLGVIVCERVKADPVLRSTRVVLVGSLFRQDRFVRQPDRDRLYGADDYIEEAIEPDDLRQRLQALLSPALAPAAAATPSTALAPPEDLQRLIRIILSDILVYYPDRCETAVREGRFVQEFRVELEEGRRLVAERFAGLSQVAEIYKRAVRDWAEERRQAHVG